MTVDVATRETASFIREQARRWPGPRILEVGCGEGEVAAVLGAEGAQVVALDASEEAVGAARARGVDARLVTWPDFVDDGIFDIVVFTRSLHHIPPLDQAVERAHRALDVGGLLLAEDFAFDAFGDRASRWLRGVLQALQGAGVAFEADSFCAELLQSESTLAAWLDDHGHELHTAEAMHQAIERVFGSATIEEVPYLYRYIRHALVHEEDRARLEDVWRNEIEVGRRIPDFCVGRRFVAEKR